MPDATVLFDSVGYRDADGATLHATRGETVTLTDAEYKRLQELGAVASPKSKEAKQASGGTSDAAGPAGQAPGQPGDTADQPGEK